MLMAYRTALSRSIFCIRREFSSVLVVVVGGDSVVPLPFRSFLDFLAIFCSSSIARFCRSCSNFEKYCESQGETNSAAGNSSCQGMSGEGGEGFGGGEAGLEGCEVVYCGSIPW